MNVRGFFFFGKRKQKRAGGAPARSGRLRRQRLHSVSLQTASHDSRFARYCEEPTLADAFIDCLVE